MDTKAKIELVQSSPESILIGDAPRLIDEWQNVPDLWNCARSEVDRRDDKFGQFIFTGSSTPADKEEIYHTGSGRIVTLPMRSMSLFETEESKGTVSLSSLFCGQKEVFCANEGHYLQDVAFYICRGGWPLSLVANRERALKITKNYCKTLFDFENSRNRKFRQKKPEILRMIVRSYARNISTEVRRGLIINDINAHEDRRLSESTFDEYVQALNDLYIFQDMEAWNPNFRSKVAVTSTPTRHFVDTSVAANALKISPADLLNDPKTFGLFFEDFAVKELSIYASCLHGEIAHYRDANGLECDSVIRLENGEYALVEMKLGGEGQISHGVAALESLKRKLASSGKKTPAFSMILTAVGDARTLENGIHIVPINLLRD